MAGAPAARTVLEVAAVLPAEAWTRQTIKEGSQGPMVADFATLRVVAVREARGAAVSAQQPPGGQGGQTARSTPCQS